MTNSLRLRRIAFFVSCVQLLAVALACTVEQGDRAASGGACPEGETCSPLAEDELQFIGPHLGNRQSTRLGPTATHGTQTITMSGATSWAGVHVETSNYWNVTISEVSEDGTFVVEALGEGDTPVDVRDAEGRLLDRLSLRSARVASVDVVDIDEATPVLAPGTRVSLVARLFDATGERLVDEGMTITAEGATLTPLSWDCFGLTIDPGARQGDSVIVRVRTSDRRTHEVVLTIGG